MRTITITKDVYTVDELSSHAFANAYSNYLSRIDYTWSSDWKNTLDAFCSRFCVKLTDYEISTYYKYSFSFETYTGSNVAQCHGIRLNKFLNNNDRYWYSYGKKFVGIEFLAEQCGLTGYCGDYQVLKPIVEAKQYKRIFNSYEELIEACIDNLFKGWLEDMEYEESEECFKEMCEANDWEFDEDGDAV